MNETTSAVGEMMISVKGIRKAFGLNAVLKGINLSVASGEVVALIGGNGAGKSTLVKILMGIYQPDEGEVFLRGQPVRLSRPSVALAPRHLPCAPGANALSQYDGGRKHYHGI